MSLTDEKLLKRAGHAARNLRLLAILASLMTLLALAVPLFAKGAPPIMMALPVSFALIAGGYWVPAVAAARGHPNSVGIVIVLMAVQITLSLIASGITAARAGTGFQPNVVGLFIPILVIVALQSSRKVLLELQTRGLWQQVFGAAKPAARLCLVGGIVITLGFVSLNATTVYVGMRAGQARDAERNSAHAFVQMIQSEEQQFMQAMRALGPLSGAAELEAALARVEALEQRILAIGSETTAPAALQTIFQTYGNAVRQWKNGLLLLKAATPDRARAQQMLQLGDKFREQAATDFDQRYQRKRENPAQE